MKMKWYKFLNPMLWIRLLIIRHRMKKVMKALQDIKMQVEDAPDK